MSVVSTSSSLRMGSERCLEDDLGDRRVRRGGRRLEVLLPHMGGTRVDEQGVDGKRTKAISVVWEAAVVGGGEEGGSTF